VDEREFQRRTRQLALDVVKLVERLPRNRTADVLGRQLLRAGTSVGANYRAACRAKSRPDMVAKLGIVEEETDEVIYWLLLLVDAGVIGEPAARDLVAEADGILAMTVASIKTLRRSHA